MLNSPWFLFVFPGKKTDQWFCHYLVHSHLLCDRCTGRCGYSKTNCAKRVQGRWISVFWSFLELFGFLSFPLCLFVILLLELVYYNYPFLYFKIVPLLGAYICFVYFFTKMKCLTWIKCNIHVILIFVEKYLTITLKSLGYIFRIF